MTAREFFDKVVSMRQCQKSYYEARRKHDADGQRTFLQKSLQVEKEIDDEIERVRRIESMQ